MGELSARFQMAYLKAYESIAEAKRGIGNYFELYNTRRRHQGLDNRTPDAVYWATLPEVKEAM